MEKQKNDVTNKELDDFFIIFAHATLFHLEQWIKAEELSGMSYLRCNFEGLGYHFQFDSLAGFGELLKSHLPDLLSMEKTQLCVEKHLETGFWPISKHETGEEKDRQVILALIVPIAESCQQLNSWPLMSLTDEQILEQYHRCRATWGDANSHFTITFPLINFSSDMGQPRQLSHHLSLAPLIPAEKTTLWNDDAKLDESQLDSTIGGDYTCRCDVAPSRVSMPAFSATSTCADMVSATTPLAGALWFSSREGVDEEASGEAWLGDDFFGREERRRCWEASSAR